MSSEKGSSKADTLVKVVLVFFISLLSFSVGTFVGKQVSDADHRRMALEGEYKADRSIASTDEHKEEVADGGDKITEKEVESLTEEFVNKEKGREPAEAAHGEHVAPTGEHAAKDEHAEAADDHKTEAVEHKEEGGYKTYQGRKTAGAEHKKEEPKAHETAAKANKETAAHEAPKAHDAHDATAKVAEKVAAGKAPTDGKKEERKPQSVLPSVASSAVGKYTVQVASYADEGEAKTHVGDMRTKGLNAFVLPAQVNGKTWFRVLVGLFNNVKSADEYRAQLMKDSGTKAAIVQKIVQ